MIANDHNSGKLVHELVRKILMNPGAFGSQWTVQGFGMFRLYLQNGLRLTVWHEKHRVPNVSLLHTHPWDFVSYIVCGLMRNQRFVKSSASDACALPYMEQPIKAGEGGGLEGEPVPVWLVPDNVELVYPRNTYGQRREEIHASYPINGTVTLCDRVVPPESDKDRALVYWEAGNQWVSAEPRAASEWQVQEACQVALCMMLSSER